MHARNMQIKLIALYLIRQLNSPNSPLNRPSECEFWSSILDVLKLCLALVPGMLALLKKTECQFNSSYDNLTLNIS